MDFHEQYPTPDPVALAALEEQVGPLPEDYRAWLMATGGGQPADDLKLGTDDLDVDERTHPVVTIFFGLGVDDAVDLGWYARTFAGRMPDGLLPVGTNDAGDLVCLEVRGEQPGSVWSWMHEEEAGREAQPYWDNLTRVADGFTPFVEGLRPVAW